MKRWHEDYRITLREWKKHRRNHVDYNKSRSVGYGRIMWQPYSDPFVVDCACDEQKGRFRKKDAWDCGNPRCHMCHNDKFPRRSKHEQELLSELSLREQLRELAEDCAAARRSSAVIRGGD
jgi:hypothetical protein